MNKTAIKNFAIWARVNLIESAKQKAFEYEVTQEGTNEPSLEVINGSVLTKEEKNQRVQLIREINAKGYDQVMEEAAYTWFNRFIALRFMEVNGYLPSKVRVFSDENGAFHPAIISEAMTVEIEGLDKEKVIELLDKQDNEALYKMLIIAQCNDLSNGLPCMFEKISNWTELLFPPNLLKADSVIGQMVSSIPEEDWLDAVQIIGWLYQYYNSELKDETFKLLDKNVKISKERIPAATQLFTPEWIVKYMVENSLGRLWVEGHPNEEIKKKWKYYLEEAEQELEVQKKLKVIRENYANIRPEDIKLIDPCMGSGHILVYAFEVLMQIYESVGYSQRDAAKIIVENNLYGLDIDDRAGQLAYFAVMMKARKYNRRILTQGITPNVFAIKDSANISSDVIKYVANGNEKMQRELVSIKDVLSEAKEYGSILDVPEIDFAAVYERLDEIKTEEGIADFVSGINKQAAIDNLLPLVKQAQIMAQKYDVVVTNPPYMGASGMSGKLSEFVKKNYPDSKSDMFAIFIERCNRMIKRNAYQAMITQHAWMFLSSFEKLRGKILKNDIENMAHLGARAFEEIGGEVVQTTAFVISKCDMKEYKGTYCRLIEPTSQQGKEDMFLEGKNRYSCKKGNFEKIPGSPVAYWMNKNFIKVFENSTPLFHNYQPKQGLATGDNGKFLRLWFEVDENNINYSAISCEEAKNSGTRWFPYNKGGEYRKWYGNNDYLVDWKNDGDEIRNFKDERGKLRSRPQNTQYYFKSSITWSKISSGSIAFRFKDKGHIFDVAGTSIFAENKDKLMYVFGVLNSNVMLSILNAISPTLNYEVGQIATLPVIESESPQLVNEIVNQNIEMSKYDWDMVETSWDFKKCPLV